MIKMERMAMFFCVLYYEIIFHILNWGMSWNHYFYYEILLSFAIGCLFLGINLIFSNFSKGYIVQLILLSVSPLPYLIEYFVGLKFGILYDVETILKGTGDAVGQFSGDIFRLLISPNGFFAVILYYLPLFGIFWIIRKEKQEKRDDTYIICKKNIYTSFAVCSTLLLLVFLLFQVRPGDQKILTESYYFETAVREIGLLPGVCIDIVNYNLMENVGFELDTSGQENVVATDSVEKEKMEQDTTDKATIEETPVTYGKNELDIDFLKMSEEATGNLAEMDAYVASLEPSSKNVYTGMFEGKNFIMITAEAFTEEVIDAELTPTLYRLATKGIQFRDYYQPASAGTTGGEYANIMGMLPSAGGSSMKKTATRHNYMTMGYLLNKKGYYGKAYHNNSYTFYSREKTHINLGYSDGYMGVGNGLEDSITDVWPQSDLEMMEATVPTYIHKEHFNIYYMSVSGHSEYSLNLNEMTKKHWDEVKDLNYSDTVKAYLGCQLEFEAALTYLVDELEKAGIAQDTVICIATDHYPYGLDNEAANRYPNLEELYRKEITNSLERDHNRLIIWSACLENQDPIIVEEPTFSPDILPTLCNLFGLEYDSRLLPGRDALSDAMPLVYTLGFDWKTDKGTYLSAKKEFIPRNEKIFVTKDYVEKVNQIVKNKIKYSAQVLKEDYYFHVFGEE